MLYKVIWDLQDQFNYSQFTAEQILNQINEQLLQVLDSYSDPDEFMFLIEQKDLQGRDCLWYLDEFDLYQLLDHKMVDNIMQEYWNGKKVDITASVLDYSTPYNIIKDKNQLYTSDFQQELKHDVFDDNKYFEKTHQLKFFVWKSSLKLRYNLMVLFWFCVLLIFQIQLSNFIFGLNLTKN